MSTSRYSVIVATGSYIPTEIVKNDAFMNHEFYDSTGEKLSKPNAEIIEKLNAITGINERRYVSEDLVTSDIAFFAAKDALGSSRIDKESLDYIIVAHNFGDVKFDNRKSDFVPSIASRVKRKLKVSNPYSVAFDIPFGCPGWLQGLIQADILLKGGTAKRALVIGAETLSRVSDPHDRDSMIYSDGAGAVILESAESEEPVGIVSHVSRSDTLEHGDMLWMDKSYNPSRNGDSLYLKMDGHKLYKYALKTVPQVVVKSMDQAGISLDQVKKVFLHQANEKMDEGIVKRLFQVCGQKNVTREKIYDLMPITISWLGNSSVATVPTLLDFAFKKKLNGHEVKAGDYTVIASVGAGMNIASMVYRIPGDRSSTS